MKGLIKGFRYITQIFDEKEPVIEIGFPTDVKHVAHIGFEGPSANTPSWMDKFDAAPELTSNLNSGEVKALPPVSNKPGKTRRKQLTSDTGSPLKSPTDAPKPSRRHRSSQNSSEAAGQESSTDPAIPKKSRRRKSKGSSNDGSSRSSARQTAAFHELESCDAGNAERNNENQNQVTQF